MAVAPSMLAFSLGSLDIAVIHQHPLHQVLNVLHPGLLLPLHLQNGQYFIGQTPGLQLLAGLIGGLERLVNGSGDLLLVEVRQSAVPLSDLGECHSHPFLSRSTVAGDYRPLYSDTTSCALVLCTIHMIPYLDIPVKAQNKKRVPKTGRAFWRFR